MPPSIWKTAKQEFVSFSSILTTVILFVGYFSISLLIINYRLFFITLGDSSLSIFYKLTLFSQLILGTFTSLFPIDRILLIINSLLVSINILLIGKTIYLLENLGKTKISVGGATVIAILTTGCSSCGLSLLSILGLSASVSFLPFHGMEIHILAIVLLVFSFWYMLRKLHEAKYCRVKK